MAASIVDGEARLRFAVSSRFVESSVANIQRFLAIEEAVGIIMSTHSITRRGKAVDTMRCVYSRFDGNGR